MIRRLLAWALLGLSCVATAGAQGVVDDAGRRVALEQPAQRVVSLAPHTTELLFAVGAGDRVVATVETSDHPPAARQLPRVGRAGRLDLEAIVARDPDLVVAWGSGNPTVQIERLRELGLPVYVDEPRTLEAIAASMLELGRLAGLPGQARAAADAYRQRLAALRERYGDRRPVSVFYQLWAEPLMTINGDHVITDVMRGCGGRNVFRDLGALAPRISIEAVIARDPEVMIASGADARRADGLAMWHDWPELRAVAQERLFSVDPDLLQRHTPRILDGMARVCRQLQQVREQARGETD
jgi:iron complex transport system substrate-binding protein